MSQWTLLHADLHPAAVRAIMFCPLIILVKAAAGESASRGHARADEASLQHQSPGAGDVNTMKLPLLEVRANTIASLEGSQSRLRCRGVTGILIKRYVRLIKQVPC